MKTDHTMLDCSHYRALKHMIRGIKIVVDQNASLIRENARMREIISKNEVAIRRAMAFANNAHLRRMQDE